MKSSSFKQACQGALLLGLASHGLAAHAQSSANYRIDAEQLSAGAASGSSAGYTLQGSVGMAVAGGHLSSSSNYGDIGFWHAVASSTNSTPATTTPTDSSTGSPSGTPPTIDAPSNSETTLTGSNPVNAAAGSTLVIPANASVAGATITLPAASANGQGAPVAIKIGGLTLDVSSSDANAVVTLKKVTINGVDTPVLAISSGSVSVRAGAGQPLLVLDNGVTIVAGSGGGTVVADKGNRISVTSGYIILPANAFAAGNGFAAIKDGRIYAGEVAELDATGKIGSVRLGSLTKDGGALGDPLKTGSLLAQAVVPKLSGKVERLSASQDFTTLLAASLGQGFTVQAQNGDGALRFGFADTSVTALPIGSVVIDTDRADGVTRRANGNVEVATGGVITTFAPTVGDLGQLAAQLTKLDPGASLNVLADGQLRLQDSNGSYAVQPSWLTQPASGSQPGFGSDAQGYARYQDGSGTQQSLYPSFADLAQLTRVLQALDAKASVVTNGDGSYRASLLGRDFTLLPDYQLIALPAAQAGQGWWQDANGKLYIANGDGKTAQGFSVR
jgi:hypothetical protein